MDITSYFQENIGKVRKCLKNDSYYIVENAYDEDFCSSVIKFINEYKESDGTEINYAGTELRIWQAEKKYSLLYKFFEESNVFMSSVLQKKTIASTLLAIRNNTLPKSDDFLKQGRWHIDSFSKQFKVFLFLSDTNELSGPFEFIPRTEKMFFKLNMAIQGKYFKFSELLSKNKRSYQQLNDELIEKLVKIGYNPQPIICKSGTLLIIDTSAIHRARPCLQGSRYALTTYYA